MGLCAPCRPRRPRSAGRLRVLAGIAGGALHVAVSLAWLALAACERPDETRCAPGADPADRSDACPFGPPGGPADDPATCAPVDFAGDGEACAVSWSEDVYPLFDDPDRGRCTNAGCHGTPEDATRARGVFIPIGEPRLAYEQLSRVRGPGGKPYVAERDPEAYVLCNLEGRPGGGIPMPKPEGRLAEEDLEIVRAWVRCGMNPPASLGEGGGAL